MKRVVFPLIVLIYLLGMGCTNNLKNIGQRDSSEEVSDVCDTASNGIDWVFDSIESIRSDSRSMNKKAASLSEILGIKVECTDPATCIFDGDGRRFHWNDCYGDILEIPNDWIPSISISSLVFSYHGAPICSPDSTCWLIPESYYSAAFVSKKEFYEGMKEIYKADSLEFHKGAPMFQTLPNGKKIRIHWTEGISKDECYRRKDLWRVKIYDEDATADYTLLLKVMPETPMNEKQKLISFYNAYPNNLRPNQDNK